MTLSWIRPHVRLHFSPVPSLPRLSWCAKLSAASDEVRVHHGPWVETRDTSFTAAVWDGDFASEDFDQATTFLGSGARLSSQGILFVAPTDPFYRLYTVRRGDELWISNSLTFVLVQSGQEPDIHHGHYFHGLLHPRRWGLLKRNHGLPLAGGQRAFLHFYCNVLIRPDLEVVRLEKNAPKMFEGFEGLRDDMVATMERVFANAGDARRVQTFRPLTTISRGYDSPAVSALAEQAGCEQAVTLRSRSEDEFFGDDDGTEIAKALGLSVEMREVADRTGLGRLHEAEFTASIPSRGSHLALFEDLLPGRVLLTGAAGDFLWSGKPSHHLSDLLMPFAVAPLGAANAEFSLRAGFFHFPVPCINGVHSESLGRLGRSPSMKPWSIGGDYDRPIARRLVEERGVPRALFGQRKQAGGHLSLTLDTMHPESRKDFIQFLEQRGLKAEKRRPSYTPRDWLVLPMEILYGILIRLPGQHIPRWLAPLILLSDRRMLDPRRRDPVFRYSFQWGFDRIKGRYEVS